ncbi:MAG TPA: malto-oligosyltrehalose synthase [Casimicrobiaceae bacterium]
MNERRIAAPALPLAAIPRATYRVQLSRDFTFADVTARVPYFAALGVSHVYCSPYLRARPGSTHGYDIVDHSMLNPELGTRDDFDRMVDALAREGMSHLCDVVPNHMAVMGADNAWWMDVLANGESAQHAAFFDIDFARHDALAGKVLVPVLGDVYGSVLERGELTLELDAAGGTFAVRYFEHRFPLDPRSCAEILLRASADARASARPGAANELDSIAYMLKALPPHDDLAPARVAARRRIADELARRIAAIVATNADAATSIERGVASFNGTAGAPASFDALHALLEAQAFRLAHWRIASDEINYRRFFDINELAALRMEHAPAFEATHAFVLALAGEGRIGGLRIDHPDGLYDPARYFEAVQQHYREQAKLRGRDSEGIYLVIEKIAAPHERVPSTWPVHGTTGYRFASVVNGLFVDAKAKARIDRAWRAFVGDEAQTLAQAAYAGRRAIMEGPLASELRVLTLRALRLARADRRTRDFTFNALREAIMEIVARFPVYRTYVDANGASAQDRRYIDWAVAHARARSRVSDASVFEFLHRALLGAPGTTTAITDALRDFAMRFQQFTAPVTAKGVEDTALYRFNRLVSLNDVGSDPEQFGFSVPAFHAASSDRAASWPHTMLATSTHDNKRSEDVRARIDVISERPAAWRTLLRRWGRMNRGRKTLVDDVPAPSRNDEYLLYQTLVGTFPEQSDEAALPQYRERIQAYMLKAVREAKVHTSWLSPSADYENALARFVAALLDDAQLFVPDLRRECAAFAWFGMLNSLSMTLLKLASPGVPDIYQGNELLDFSLVDPDNRRPVDYAVREAHLASLDAIDTTPPQARGARIRALFDAPLDGRAKLFVVARTLSLRKRLPALFAYGDYRPVAARGVHGEHVVAFARSFERDTIVVAAGRLLSLLGPAAGALPGADAWGDTALDVAFIGRDAAMTNILSGAPFEGASTLSLARLFADFPGALLHFEAR